MRVLHLEDSPRDAEIIRRKLESGGLGCDVLRVETEAQFVAALAAEVFDLILCDYNLPDYDGLDALTRALEQQPGTPVLLISGTLGEDKAVQCLQLGATDYLLKERLDRLPAAVKRALTEAAERRRHREVEMALERERVLLRTVIDLLPDHIYVKDTQSRFLLANRGVALAMGVAGPEQLIGKADLDFYPEGDSALFRRDEQDVLAGHALLNKEEPVVHPDGSQRFILTTKVPLRDPAGNIIGLVGIGRDFTERKQAEEALRQSEERFAKAFEASPAAVNIVTVREGRLLMANNSYCQFFGYTRAELIGRTVLELGIHADPAQRAPLIERLLAQGSVRDYEVQARRKDGTVRDGLLAVEFFNYPGVAEPVLISTFTDITERKQAEEALRESESHYRVLYENSPYCIHEIDRAGRLTLMNRAGLRMLGVQEEGAICGLPLLSAVAEADRERIGRLLELAFQGQAAEFEFQAANGSLFQSSFVPITNVQGVVLRIMGLTQDITMRKQAEAALRESEERYRLLADYAEDFVTLNDTEGGRLYVSPSFYRATGWPKEVIQGTGWRSRAHPDDLPLIERTRVANLAGESTTLEHRIRCADGRWLWVESRCKPILGRGGKVEKLLVWGRDITARKQAEAAVQASQQMLQLILDNIPQGVFWKDRESRYLGCNAVVAQTFGVAPAASLLGKSDLDFGSITPEQAAFFVQKDREVMESNRPQLGIIEPSTFADGRARWLETNKLPLCSPSGEVIGVLGTWQDITERKEAQEVLQRRASELERFHRLSVGRELQMIDLKKEVNALAQQAGRTPPYDLSFLEKPGQPKAQP
ncbi:MAG: hypothetical protein RL514_2422 [Verrucomicrobiota bacterium]|jgi:PAS domain S-box-containing protein